MLETYGLHELTWDACDERLGDILVASPADAGGRGIALTVRENGAAADLTGATVTVTDKNGTTTADIARGAQGEKGDTGEQGSKGEKGEIGETGPQGPTGPAGADGTTFTPAPPLPLTNGVLSIDLSSYATKQYVEDAISALADLSEEEF